MKRYERTCARPLASEKAPMSPERRRLRSLPSAFEVVLMSCCFRGPFSREEKESLIKSARAVERPLSRDAEGQPSWAFLHFGAP